MTLMNNTECKCYTLEAVLHQGVDERPSEQPESRKLG